MKKLIPISLLMSLLAQHLAFADEFNRNGLQINFSGNSSEIRLGPARQDRNHYLIKQMDASDPSRTLVESFIHITPHEISQQDGPEKAAETCAMLAATRVSKVKLLAPPKSLKIAGRAAMTFTMGHLGRYVTDTWPDDIVNVAVYCIIEPSRQIEIQVIVPSEAPEKLFLGTLKNIEAMKIE